MKKTIFLLTFLLTILNSTFCMSNSLAAAGLKLGTLIHLSTDTYSISGIVIHIEGKTIYVKDQNALANPAMPCYTIDFEKCQNQENR